MLRASSARPCSRDYGKNWRSTAPLCTSLNSVLESAASMYSGLQFIANRSILPIVKVRHGYAKLLGKQAIAVFVSVHMNTVMSSGQISFYRNSFPIKLNLASSPSLFFSRLFFQHIVHNWACLHNMHCREKILLVNSNVS